MFDVYLPLADTTVWWPGLVVLGLAVGVLTGLFGVGGGFLLTPALRIIFGIPYPIAVGSDLLQIFLTALYSAGRHWQRGNVEPRLGILMAAGAFGGTEIGVRILTSISVGSIVGPGENPILALDLILNCLFLLLMAGTTIFIFRENSQTGKDGEGGFAKLVGCCRIPPLLVMKSTGGRQISVWMPILLSVAVGTLTGLMGVGGGFINFPLLIYAIGLPTALAAGTSAFQVLFASGYGALRHAGQQHLELAIVGFLLVGSLVGVQFGLRLCQALGGKVIRKNFAYVLLLAMALIVFDLGRKIMS